MRLANRTLVDRVLSGGLAAAILGGLLAAPVGAAGTVLPGSASATGRAGTSARTATRAEKTLAPHAADVLLVGFRPGATGADRAAARASVRALSAHRLSPLATDAERWQLPAGSDLRVAMDGLLRNPRVRFAEPDWTVTSADVPNDPYFTNGTLWGMEGPTTTPANAYGSNAAAAWAAGYTGSRAIYVGIIDEGFQFSHPELSANTWTNPDEPLDGVDNDANGYIDDVHGWDFYSNDSSTYDGVEDDHGTHVSGTIGGQGGNGLGVVGVNWQVSLISGKFLGPTGGYTSGAVAAVDYMTWLKVHKGLDIVATSNSWGGGGFSQALLDAIDRGGDQNILFIAAAGNSASNNDVTDSYPSNYECTRGGTRGWDCVIAVAAIDATGSLASFSSYGATRVDLGAPGVAIHSSVPTDAYASYNGTSMATPHVSGAAALCASIAPAMSAADIKAALLATTVATSSLTGRTATDGRLNAGALPTACRPPTGPPSGDVTAVAAAGSTTSTLRLTWVDGVSGETGFEIQAARGTLATCGTFAAVGATVADRTAYTVTGLSTGTDYCFRVRATNSYGGMSATAWSDPAFGRTSDPPPASVCRPVTYTWIDPTGGTNLNLTDDSSSGRSLPFAWNVDGIAYTSTTISSNGFVRLGSGTATGYGNVGIPMVTDPNAYIAPAWDDWNPSLGGSVSLKTIGTAPTRRFVVTWADVPHFNVSGSAASFQAILEEGSDTFRLQYRDLTLGSAGYDQGGSSTAGIEGATGEWGTQLSYNSPTLLDGTAYRCSTGATLGPTIGWDALPDGTTGSPYRTTLTATDGTGPYTWSLAAGTLPAGLALDAASGAIAGTPTGSGTSTFTVRATTADGTSATRAATIRIAAPLAVATAALVKGTWNAAYATTLTASGGTSPYTWSVVGGSLPAGLSLSASGILSGTPTVSGVFPISVAVSDSGVPVARSAARVLSLTVGRAPTISTATYPDGTTGAGYAVTLTATDGSAPYTWSLASGSLPAGLALDPSTGTIGGTPSASGTASFTVRAIGVDGSSGTRAGSIRVATPLAIRTSSLPGAIVGSVYGTPLEVTGGTGPFAWSLASGALPAGLTLVGSGSIAGTPTAAGSFTVTLAVSDAALPTPRVATRTMSLIVGQLPVIAAVTFPDGTTLDPYAARLSASSGQTPYTWSLASGSLPPGLSLDSSSGMIAGAPVGPGSSSFVVRVTGADGGSSTASGAIRVADPLVIRTAALGSVIAGVAYAATLDATGGSPVYLWSLDAGTLPSGLALSPGGVISGTTSASGTFPVTIRVIDGGAPTPRFATVDLTLSIVRTPTILTDTYPTGTVGTAWSQRLAATDGTAPYVWTLAGGTLPDGLLLDGGTGIIAGTPTAAGTFVFSVRATGQDGGSSVRGGTIVVADPITVTTTALPGGTVGTGYGAQLLSIGGRAPYAWTLSSGALQAGLALEPSTGTITGTPAMSGSAALTVRVTDADGRSASATLTLDVVSAPAIATPAVYPDGTTGSPYRVPLTVSNAVGPFTWSISAGSLPAGLALDGSTGAIAGTPTAAGSSSFTVKVAGIDGGGATATGTIRVAAPLAITTSTLAPAAGTSFSGTLAATGGTAPIAWSIDAGSLPAGLALNGSTGVISGTATASGSYTIVVRATDAAQPVRRSATRVVTVTIAFTKASPANNAKLAATTSTSLAWYAHVGAVAYRYCLTTSTKGCSTWVTPAGGATATSAGVTVARGSTYYWQVQVQTTLGGTWTAANAGTLWKFSVSR